MYLHLRCTVHDLLIRQCCVHHMHSALGNTAKCRQRGNVQMVDYQPYQLCWNRKCTEVFTGWPEIMSAIVEWAVCFQILSVKGSDLFRVSVASPNHSVLTKEIKNEFRVRWRDSGIPGRKESFRRGTCCRYRCRHYGTKRLPLGNPCQDCFELLEAHRALSLFDQKTVTTGQ